MKKKITIEDMAMSIKGISEKIDNLATKEELKEEIDGLAIITKENFDRIDFRFAIVDDRFHDMDKRFNQIDKRFDRIESEVTKTNDSFARLKNYVDCEIAAVRGHLMRVDEKIGLAGT